MSKNIQKIRNEAHFIQWELKPNFENIFKTLQENELIDKTLKISEWTENVDIILGQLNEIKDTNWDIVLKYFWKFNFKDDSASSFAERQFERQFKLEFERFFERTKRKCY